jgi:hypothetical protein
MAQADVRTPKPQLTPPDERFWQRYSPHAEFPLSSASSLAVHLLLFGVLILLAWLGTLFFNQGNRSLPVESVRLDLGGGGGDPHGSGDGPNTGQPKEASGDQPRDNATESAPPDDTTRPKKIDVQPGTRLQMSFDEESTRFLQQTDTQAAQTFQSLSNVTSRLRLSDGKASGYGQGGKGSGGGSGDGRGKGIGDGEGSGHGKLTKREKRMLRWTMLFRPQSPAEYVSQLSGLGAILAFPISGSKDYQVVRNLSVRPARLEDQDITKLNRIYWFDNKPGSVAQVVQVLGLPIQPPDHFVAFMPEEVEQKLYQREDAYLKKHYPGRTEDDISETRFRLIEKRGGGIELEVSDLKVKGSRR